MISISSFAYAVTIGGLIADVNKFIINPLITFIFALAVIMFLYGMVRFLAERNTNSEAASNGKRNMFWGMVGMLIMVSVFGILQFIANTLEVDNINFRTGDVDSTQVTSTIDNTGLVTPTNQGSTVPSTTGGGFLSGNTATNSGNTTNAINTIVETVDVSQTYRGTTIDTDTSYLSLPDTFVTQVNQALVNNTNTANGQYAKVGNLGRTYSCSGGDYRIRYRADIAIADASDYDLFFNHYGFIGVGDQLSALQASLDSDHQNGVVGFTNVLNQNYTSSQFYSNQTANTPTPCNGTHYMAAHETFSVSQ